jgi:hypothetical protein
VRIEIVGFRAGKKRDAFFDGRFFVFFDMATLLFWRLLSGPEKRISTPTILSRHESARRLLPFRRKITSDLNKNVTVPIRRIAVLSLVIDGHSP